MKKNIIKAVIALVFIVVGAISLQTESKAIIQPDDCPGGSCTYHDNMGWDCSSCCPQGKDPDCGPTGCTCF